VEYRLLGPLEVRGSDGLFALGGAKQRGLLALLLVNANRVVARDRLIEGLWGERPPETAVATIQVYVSRLRKLLPPGALETRPPGYLLAVEPEDLDLTRFELLVDDARGAEPVRARERLRRALALWRGPPLAEFGDQPFARVEAARLEELRLAALEKRIEADLALGLHTDLVAEVERLVAENPHRERLHGHLMLALYRSGRQAEAMAAYRRMREALDEVGIEPGAAIRQLERQILTQDSALDPAPQLLTGDVVLPGPLRPVSPFPFVGRAAELATLRGLLERAEAGAGGMVLLEGEAGAGKTRLVRELANEAAGRGVLVCYGMSDAVVVTPYQPLREWLEFLVSVCDPDVLRGCVGAQGQHLMPLVPGLAPLPGEPTPESETGADRFALHAAATELLVRVSSRWPLLLVLDDVHWADAETLHLLRRLARKATEAQWLVVAAYRRHDTSRELEVTLADLQRVDTVTRLRVGGLDADEVSAFIRASTRAEPTSRLVSVVGELTDGTPLLVCELWRELVASDAVEVAEALVRLTRPIEELRSPEGVEQFVTQRLSRLSSGARRFLEFAAVAGPRFELRVVAAAVSREGVALTRAVEQATRSGMLEELTDPVASYRFTHELIRRAVYDRISGLRSRDLHLRIGEALEETHGPDLSGLLPELAHHFTIAAPLAGKARAVDYNLRAAEESMASFAYGEAASRLSIALDLGIEDARERLRVQIELGHLLYETGRIAESDEVLTAGLSAATTLEERGLATRALVHSLIQRLSTDPGTRSADVIPLAEEAVKTFEQLGDAGGLALAGRLLAGALSREGRIEESFAAAERALEHAEAAGDRATRRAIIGLIARQLCDGPTPAPEGITRLDGLRARSRDDPMLDAAIRQFLAVLLAMTGCLEESREHLRASTPILAEVAQERFSLPIRWVAAETKELAGDRAGAERNLTVQFLRTRGARGDEPDARALRAAASLALHCADQGRWEEAANHLLYGAEVDRSEPARGKVYTPLRLAARGRVAAHRGELAEARRLAMESVEIAERGGRLNDRARVWLALADVQRANGRESDARTAVARALELYERKGNVVAAARLREAQSTEQVAGG
jgi:DNA-binding SARP family transcriptional activator